ncbi:glycosyltransferase family 2 protein [Ruficoccus sp. ZRK36]|uniref:glycosyltransferase family 2 protein n=1 Tax=Ruficoccus sp. ZRK36 TaxID=2866311 RepID=UPI001C735C16|nr:glycosyltransferase family 2 protein [Ruficoccus sp. ZRK36]QYY37076.1 glycosyltransferase family 2 protein [Ruficoccus sp. ZRK36]
MDAADAPTLPLSFIIPVLNEGETIETLFNKITAVIQEEQLGGFEVIFVDDGSTDTSWQRIDELAEAHEEVRGLRFRRNFGKAAALAAGFQEARGKIVFTLDADLQDDPEEIPHFLKKLDEGYDLVSGWKKDRQDPLEKRLPSKLYNAVACRAGGVKLHDMNCGFKAYRREVLPHLNLYGELHRYVPVLAHAEGFSVTEIPVKHHPREHGVSKYGWKRYIKGMLDLLTVLATTRFLDRPGHLFGGLGLASSSLGFLILFYISCMKLIAGVAIAGRPLFFLGILLMLLGMQLISLGVIGELIIRFQRHDGSAKIIERTDDKSTHTVEPASSAS